MSDWNGKKDVTVFLHKETPLVLHPKNLTPYGVYRLLVSCYDFYTPKHLQICHFCLLKFLCKDRVKGLTFL